MLSLSHPVGLWVSVGVLLGVAWHGKGMGLWLKTTSAQNNPYSVAVLLNTDLSEDSSCPSGNAGAGSGWLGAEPGPDDDTCDLSGPPGSTRDLWGPLGLAS